MSITSVSGSRAVSLYSSLSLGALCLDVHSAGGEAEACTCSGPRRRVGSGILRAGLPDSQSQALCCPLPVSPHGTEHQAGVPRSPSSCPSRPRKPCSHGSPDKPTSPRWLGAYENRRGKKMKAPCENLRFLELTFGLAQDLVVKLLFLIFQEGVFLLQVCDALKERITERVFPREPAKARLLLWGLTFSWLSSNALLM